MHENLQIIYWPDPRLLRMSRAVDQFDSTLGELVRRMFELMRGAKGVGLAAPQVGQNIRLFVMNSTGKPEDDRVYVNPFFSDPEGEEEGEEGCLSLPGINIKVVRSKAISIAAQDLSGEKFIQRETGYPARIWQHEFDHLNGTLLTDHMGPVARMAHRKTLKELEAKYQAAHPAPARKPARQRTR